MPGFKILKDQQGNKSTVKKAAFTYTWEMTKFQGINPLFFYLKEAEIPSFDLSTEKVETANATYEFANGIKWNDIKIVFYDTKDTVDRLMELTESVWSADNGLRSASDYMSDSIIKVYYQDGSLAHRWVLYNSWIKKVAYSKLTYEDTGVNNITVTLSYSWATQDQRQ
jgi:hypothetical protein